MVCATARATISAEIWPTSLVGFASTISITVIGSASGTGVVEATTLMNTTQFGPLGTRPGMARSEWPRINLFEASSKQKPVARIISWRPSEGDKRDSKGDMPSS